MEEGEGVSGEEGDRGESGGKCAWGNFRYERKAHRGERTIQAQAKETSARATRETTSTKEESAEHKEGARRETLLRQRDGGKANAPGTPLGRDAQDRT